MSLYTLTIGVNEPTKVPNAADLRLRRELVELTSLRGIAALGVWFCHMGPEPFAFGPYQEMGRTGVTLFFVLSGFILQCVYRNCSFSHLECYTAFYVRRVARILPLYWISLAISYVSYACLQDGSCTASDYIGFALSPVALQSWSPCGSLDWGQVTWTVSAEMFFYAVFPLLVKITSTSTQTQFRVGLLCLLISTVPTAITACVSYETFNYVYCVLRGFPLLRVTDFLFGMIMARHAMRMYESQYRAVSITQILRMDVPLGLVLMTVLIAPLISINMTYYLNTGNWITLLSGWLLFNLFVANESGCTAMILGLSVIVAFGKISFAFYLTHLPVLQTLPVMENQSLKVGIWFFATFGVASLLHYGVEDPIYRHVTKRIASKCVCGFVHAKSVDK
jgi:peptidoglycan/LPS O-acetylase OafA/YrhL